MKPPYIPFPAFTPAPSRGRSWGGVARVVGTGALCVLCYEAGRWTRALEIPVEAPAFATPVAAKTAVRDFSDFSAPGQSVEDPVPQITSLNDRDPAALIMGPGSTEVASSERTATPPDDEDGPPIRHEIRPKPSRND